MLDAFLTVPKIMEIIVKWHDYFSMSFTDCFLNFYCKINGPVRMNLLPDEYTYTSPSSLTFLSPTLPRSLLSWYDIITKVLNF